MIILPHRRKYHSDGGAAYSAKSVVFDVANQYGAASYMGIRSIDFILASEIITMNQTLSSVYGDFAGTKNFVWMAFDTSLSKIGSQNNTSWLEDSVSSRRIIIVFNDPIEFDGITINNSHSFGDGTNYGAKDVKITMTDATYTDKTYNAAVTDGVVIFDGTWLEHVALNQPDPEILSLL